MLSTTGNRAFARLGRPGSWPVAVRGAFADGRTWGFFVRRDAAEVGDEPADEATSSLCRTPKMARLEAALFVATGALSTRKLAQSATLADASEARELIERLNEAYDAGGSSFRIERVASGYRLLTRPEFAFWLDKLHQRQSEVKLSAPAMETLTIVAYRQPITRADVESLRGVQSAEMLKYLMERGLVKIGGEDDSLGRPYLYVTTRKFLEHFGLRTLDDLPMAEQLRRQPEEASETGDDAAGEGEAADETDDSDADEDVTAADGEVASDDLDEEASDADLEDDDLDDEYEEDDEDEEWDEAA